MLFDVVESHFKKGFVLFFMSDIDKSRFKNLHTFNLNICLEYYR